MRLLPALLAFLFVLSACNQSSEKTGQESATVASDQLGTQVYSQYCTACHQPNGDGVQGLYPPLRASEWVTGDKGRLIRLVLNGVQGEMEVNGETYNNLMTAHGFLTDEQIAAVLTYIRQNLDNDADAVSAAEVAAVRSAEEREGPWDAQDLWTQTGIPGQ